MSFDPFEYTRYSLNTGCNALDRPKMTHDECECCNPRGEPCCSDCCLCMSPFAIVADIVTLIPRGIHHLFKKCSKPASPAIVEDKEKDDVSPSRTS